VDCSEGVFERFEAGLALLEFAEWIVPVKLVSEDVVVERSVTFVS
jgi:hypothetical protein